MTKKVFIVDDSRFHIQILTDILEKEGFTVFSTIDSLSVFRMAQELQPDVILLDIVMPEINGFEVCYLLKNNYDTSDIPVIMVTNKTNGSDIKIALELGALDYIKKPFEEIEVIARINSALRLKSANNKLKDLSRKDCLTKLYNRATFMQFLDKELKEQKTNNSDLCFIMIDIDKFKEINDSYGHLAGDIVLKEISNILTTSVREKDIVSRYGGDEFNLILPLANKKDALLICERIRQKIENFNFNIGPKTINITISVGLFVKKANDNITYNDILRKADQELYSAKSKGRNRIEVYECLS